MAKSDIIVKWKADTQNYDANIAKAKRQLEGFTKQNLTAGGQLQMLTKSLVGTAAKFASFGAAAAGAMKVMKDAFFNNEQQLDEWSRVVESSHSVYAGFLDALNTGDISGFLGRIDQIVQAARDAYNALDELGTFNAFNQINVERTRTNMTESIADYRSGTGSKDAVRAAGDAYKKELAERKKLEREAYLEAVKKTAAERGVNAKDLLDALSGSYGSYTALKNQPLTGTRQTVVGAGMYAQRTTEQVAANDRERLGQALRRLNDTELQSLQALGAQAERTGNEIAQVDKQLTRVLNGRGGVGGGGGSSRTGGGSTVKAEVLPEGLQRVDGVLLNETMPSLRDLQQQLSAFSNALENATTQGQYQRAKAGIARTERAINAQPLALEHGISIDEAEWRQTMSDALENIGKDIKPIEIKPIEGLVKYADQAQEAFQMAAQSVGTLGSALAGLEDPAVKAAGTVLQAIASITLGFAQASVQAASLGPFGWVAFLGAGMAALATTISTVHSLTHLQEGGIVPGNYYSGDNINGGGAMVNSGELVLTRAQQSTLASQLQGGDGSGQGRQPYVSGEQIYLGVTNYLKRSGRGEIVTTR